jgi:serine/threonine-protein kinase
MLEEERALEPRRALALTRQILDGLRHAHGLGVVHRDLKPDNVLLVRREEQPEFVKILDLGIAKLAGPDDVNQTRLTQKGEVFGTPLYMSPEQVRGDEIDARADLYSLTVMLFEMLAARPPFVSNTSMGLFAMHLATPPPPLLEANPELSGARELQALIDRGLAKDPAERYQSAEQFLESVEGALASDLSALTPKAEASASTAPRAAQRAKAAPRPEPAAPGPARARRAWLATREGRIVAVVLVLALAALLVWSAWGFVSPEP